MVRHVLGISGGKDSAALSIYLKNKYPDLQIDYYNSDTGCELEETYQLIDRLESVLGHITRLRAAEGSPEPTPFHHFLKATGGFLPSPQARWCTQKMKLAEFEKYVGDAPTISYVGIRGDEEREGYVSTRPNIQAIFPFRRNIWSLDVINKILNDNNITQLKEIYQKVCPEDLIAKAIEIIQKPLTKQFFYSKKLNALLDLDIKIFNQAVFEYLKTTDYPVGKLDTFPLLDNEDVLKIDEIYQILEDSGVGIPAYYKEIEFEVDGKKGTYSRSRSGCYFCFYQQKIEWIWLYEQHPDLFQKAMEFEKDGYTWNQGESLADLIKPERIRQIKLDAIKRQELKAKKKSSSLLVDLFADDNDVLCANCFI
ncbi:MAG: phosphoadenosine phosphosulfate reductase [Massilibacteroides sp.]|nr:phosphoadenosine phosphosulfate reductase [Massilibacteroides sp.]MDD4532032.1 phosphoadenosine phosphosulfate reductase [Bacilli bacterium]